MTSSPDRDIRQPPSAKQITDDLVRLVEEVAGTGIDPGTGLLASGLTSANLVALLARASARWHVDIPVGVLFDGGDLTSLAEHVRTAMSATGAGPSRKADTSSGSDQHTGSADERKALRNRIRTAVGKRS